MKNAIILHGTCSEDEYYSNKYPSASNSHWIPWLQKQLLIKDISAVTPEMFHSYAPDYEKWKEVFEQNKITSETILVGHSCGGGFLVRRLSENVDIDVGKVVLVAPWLDPDNEKGTDFFDFLIDSHLVSRTKGCIVFASSNDDSDVKRSIETIVVSIPNIIVKNFQDYGHFCLGDMGTQVFPELLDELV